MNEIKVTRTPIYGLRPHDVYTVSVGDAVYQLREATPRALAEALGADGAEPCDLEALMAGLESAGGAAFEESEEIDFAREMLRRDILRYDCSAAVNSVLILTETGTIATWLDAETRNHLVTSIATWSATHEDYTLDLREAGKAFTLPCNTLLEWLGRIENYAVACYNTTSAHLREAGAAETVAALAQYDYKAGYPQVLTLDARKP